MDVKTLSGILGHTRAAFTLDTYTHTTEPEKCDPIKDDSSSGSSTDSDGFGGHSGEKFYTVPLSLSHFIFLYVESMLSGMV